jgi:acetyltransferase-like isoleucine patch superfamily enzyme
MSRLVLQPPPAQPFVPLRRLLNDFGQEVHNHRLVGINRYSNQGHNNQIALNGCTFKHSTLTVQGNHNQILIAPNTRLSYLDIYLQGDNHRLVIGADCYLQGRIELLGNANTIHIGQGTTTFNVFVGAFEENCSIDIGDDCMFSGDIDIRTGDSHGIIDAASQRLNHPRNVKIGNHVWIGQRVIVLKGTQIGDNSIIGAGAIVSKDIPPNSVAAGVPAKVVKTGVNWVRDLATLT